MEMLNERSKDKSALGYKKIWACNTFFFKSLCDKGYNGVRRWSKRAKVDIFTLDYVIIPVHLGVHWTMACIDMKLQSVSFYDSMGGAGESHIEILRSYVGQEHKDKKGMEIDVEGDWELESKRRTTECC